MHLITAVIVDDEQNARENLEVLLRENCEKLQVSGMAATVSSAVALIQEVNPDLLFLDIEIGEGSGFDILRRIPDFEGEIIFVTAFSQYAIKSFKFSAIDYLLKPIDIDDLVMAVERARKRIQKTDQGQNLAQFLTNLVEKDRKSRKIGLPVQSGVHFYPLEEIVRLQSQSNYTTFYLTSGREILVSKTLKEYEELLSDQGFARVHQSHIINLEHITQYIKSDGGYLLLSDHSNVPISKNYKEQFLEQLNKF